MAIECDEVKCRGQRREMKRAPHVCQEEALWRKRGGGGTSHDMNIMGMRGKGDKTKTGHMRGVFPFKVIWPESLLGSRGPIQYCPLN